MGNYKIEIGENKNNSTCHCCGKNSYIGHGFVYKDENAYAVYYVGWSEFHIEKSISIAISIGEWSDDSKVEDRCCFGIKAFESQDEILFSVIEPRESPWPKTDLLGEMMTRKEGLSNKLCNEVFEIVENILRTHPAIKLYLLE